MSLIPIIIFFFQSSYLLITSQYFLTLPFSPSPGSYGGSVVRNSPATAGDTGPLEEEMATTPVFLTGKCHGQRGIWQATVPGVTKSQTGLSD